MIMTSMTTMTGSIEIASRMTRPSGMDARGKEKARIRVLPPVITVAPPVRALAVNENMKTPMSRKPM